jgi:hypothetical protein
MGYSKPTPQSHTPSGEPPWQPHLWNNTSTSKNSQIKASHNCYSYMLNDLHTVPRVHGKPQPGAYGKLKLLMNSNNRLNCSQVRKGVMHDNPNMKVINCEKGQYYRCKPGYYKGFMMVSPGKDFHFARQDNRMIGVYRKMHKDLTILPKSKSKLEKLYTDYVYSVIPNIVKLAHTLYPNVKTRKQLLKAVFKTAHVWSHKPGASNATDKDASGNYILNPMKANWDFAAQGGINYSQMCCFFEIPSNYTNETYSTGYSFVPSNIQNNPVHVRTNLSKNNSIDQQYEQLLLMVIEVS